MCGIAGIISGSKGITTIGEIKAMTDIISHRGPDGEGHYIGDQGNIALGHRRLSIIDLSDAANQPMTKDDIVLIFNGEVYNYIEIREELKLKGYHFDTSSDTEVIIKAYREWGQDCVNHFNGMWAFAIHDKSKDIVFCSRDRFGIKPFYYYEVKDKFYFASEIKQFTVLEGWIPELDKTLAFEYLFNGYHHHTEKTFFKTVNKLQQGTNLIYDLKSNTFHFKKYYLLTQRKLESTDNIKEFKSLFKSAVELRLRADVKVGTALSGGIDSSAVVCTVNELLKQNDLTHLQETVSAVYENRDYDESYYINEVANHLKITNHKTTLSFDEVMQQLDKTIWHMDEPFGSMSMIASSSVFKTAKANDIIVMLNGQGADEILGGYDKFYKVYLESLIKEKKYFKVIKTVFQYFRLHNISIAYVAKQAFHYIKKFSKQDKSNSWLDPSMRDEDTIPFVRSKEEIFFDVSKNLIYGIGMPALLHYEDRNSMTHSVEARVPFLDYRLVEYAVSLPNDLKIHNAVRKYILREAMKPQFPKSIYERYDKLGFVTPQEKWMRDNFERIEQELIDFANANKYIIKTIFLDLVTKFKSGEFSDSSLFWRVLVFGRWLRIFKIKLI